MTLEDAIKHAEEVGNNMINNCKTMWFRTSSACALVKRI
jgi:hypothetical protein